MAKSSDEVLSNEGDGHLPELDDRWAGMVGSHEERLASIKEYYGEGPITATMIEEMKRENKERALHVRPSVVGSALSEALGKMMESVMLPQHLLSSGKGAVVMSMPRLPGKTTMIEEMNRRRVAQPTAEGMEWRIDGVKASSGPEPWLREGPIRGIINWVSDNSAPQGSEHLYRAVSSDEILRGK